MATLAGMSLYDKVVTRQEIVYNDAGNILQGHLISVYENGIEISRHIEDFSGSVVAGATEVDKSSIEVITRCDDQGSGTIIKFYRVNRYSSSGNLLTSTLQNADGTAYTILGTEKDCTPNANVECKALCDIDASSDVVARFIRHVIYDNLGNVGATFDTEIDMTTSHTSAVGTTQVVCDNEITVESEILCDDNTDPTTSFLRFYVLGANNTVISISDKQLDGTTAYVLVGNAVDCRTSADAPDDDVEIIERCDDQGSGVIVKFYRINRYNAATGALLSSSVQDEDGTAYTVVGTEKDCQSIIGFDTEHKILCDIDVNGDVVGRFIRHVVYDGEGDVVSTLDTQLDMTTTHTHPASSTVTSCEVDMRIVSQVLCDDTTNFLRLYLVGKNNDIISKSDVQLDGTTAYTVTGTVQSCEQAFSVGVITTEIVQKITFLDTALETWTMPANAQGVTVVVVSADGSNKVKITDSDLVVTYLQDIITVSWGVDGDKDTNLKQPFTIISEGTSKAYVAWTEQ